MPDIETAWRYQKAVVWMAVDNEFTTDGQHKVSAPIELTVRWENVRREATDAQGNTILIEAVVVVDRLIPVGSVMWEGSMVSLPGTSETPDSDVMEVLSCSEIPDINNQYVRRVCNLMRRSDRLPEIV